MRTRLHICTHGLFLLYERRGESDRRQGPSEALLFCLSRKKVHETTTTKKEKIAKKEKCKTARDVLSFLLFFLSSKYSRNEQIQAFKPQRIFHEKKQSAHRSELTVSIM